MALFYLEPSLKNPLRTFFGSTDDAKCQSFNWLIGRRPALEASNVYRSFRYKNACAAKDSL